MTRAFGSRSGPPASPGFMAVVTMAGSRAYARLAPQVPLYLIPPLAAGAPRSPSLATTDAARGGMRLGDARLEMDRRGEHPLDETDGGVHGADARRSSGGTQARTRNGDA